jgi:uncharacterized damage-inducible protein DinB
MKLRVAAVVLLAGLSATGVWGRQNQPAVKPANGSPAGFRGEFLTDLADVEDKLTSLARAVPGTKYAWRPAPGVRSVSEVFMHVAGGNYYLATFLGVQPPAGLPKDLEKIADKQRVLAELQKSFDHVRAVARTMSDADLEKSVTMFGQTTTQRRVLSTVLYHLHEHLGQSIAYARANRVVPPWSR